MDPLDELASILCGVPVRFEGLTFLEAGSDDELFCFGDVGADDEIVGVVGEGAEFAERQGELGRLSWASAAEKGVPSMLLNLWSQLGEM